MPRRLREESGIALVMALMLILVFSIVTAAAITYTTVNNENAGQSSSSLQALQYAEAGLNDAYSTIVNANSSGNDPTTSTLLGTSSSPTTFCITSTSCSAGSAGSVSVMGCYGGNNGTTCSGISPSAPASTWVIQATGYASQPLGGTVSRIAKATVLISALTSGAVAAVWNHLFLTGSLVSGVCQTTFAGNSLIVDVPIYAIGNVCITGNSDQIKENGQPVDVMIGGKLVLSGNSSSIGASSTSPITSGVVVGGCTTVAVTSSTSPCDGTSPSFHYWVGSKDTYVANDAPTLTASQIQSEYTNDDPGPNHSCLAGTNPAPPAASSFDNDTTYNDSAGTFELVPASSYACISQNGASKGYLIWNNSGSSITVSGVTVGAHTLAVNGSIFIDGNVTISQSAYYTGTADLDIAGNVTFQNNSTQLCATSPCNTATNAWQGSSGNNSMLTLVMLGSSSVMTLGANSQTFQGSIWSQPTGSVTLSGNSDTLEGPMSMGSINLVVNSATLKPLPVIKNMPVGAPVPPNTSVSIGALSIIK